MSAKVVKGHSISFTELGEEVMGLNVPRGGGGEKTVH